MTIVNHSFEDVSGQTVYNEFTFGTPTGWTLYDPFGIVSIPDVYVGTLDPSMGAAEFFNGDPAPDGDRVMILFNSGQKAAGEYGFFQTLGDTLQANTHYSLTVDVGNIGSGTAIDSTFYDLSNFPGYRVDLLAGGVVIASDNDSLVIPEYEWATSVISFTTGDFHAQLGQSLGIRLVSLNATNDPGVDNEVDFDNVILTATPIPEPHTWGLLLIGVIFVICKLRRCVARDTSNIT
ncbi:hypothetical protein QQ056_16100 [Oscillatoria laete-virens NRMC-F 0139]|nr:hypothetical protein [Oscillatoria laete-virens]MDL5055061.1 hypothetical protein [Oscillatoria laete-virens NRMC-F 0139]